MKRVSSYLAKAVLTAVTIVSAPRVCAVETAAPTNAKTITIVVGAKAGAPELKAAEILSKRLIKRSGVSVTTVTESAPAPAADVTLVVGTADGNGRVKTLLHDFHTAPPTLPNSERVHPEGFAVKSGAVDGKPYVVVAGADGPGTHLWRGLDVAGLDLPSRLGAVPVRGRDRQAGLLDARG